MSDNQNDPNGIAASKAKVDALIREAQIEDAIANRKQVSLLWQVIHELQEQLDRLEGNVRDLQGPPAE